jgi:hypothetical protein
MKALAIYDPPMCCSSGVCGTDIDPKLLRLASDVNWLRQQGVPVERFNLAQQPAAFAANPAVSEALRLQGNDCLPLVTADGAIVARSVYPTREALVNLAGLESGRP